MTRLAFRVGDVFPADDRVSQFLTGLAMVVNDVTLVMRQFDRLEREGAGPSREATYYLYLTCSYYREAAKYLDTGFQDPQVLRFLEGLSDQGREKMEIVRASFTPFGGSFVESTLKPIRDVVFHYSPWSFEQLAKHLEHAADDVSGIEMGAGGRYLDSRYEFADAVFEEFVLASWGRGEDKLRPIVEKMGELVLALTHFAHEAMSLHLDSTPRQFLTVEQTTAADEPSEP